MSEVYYPVGRYRCTVLQQGFSTAGTGTPQFVLRFMVCADGAGNAFADVQRKERTYYKALTEKTMEYFAKDLKNLGVTVTSLSQLDPEAKDAVLLVGREVNMYCQHGTDRDGNAREEWGVALSDMEMKPPPASTMRSLDMLFGRAMRANGGGTPAPRPATPRQATPAMPPVPVPAGAYGEPSDDDIPL